jgi:hypothetical protein
MSKTTTTVYKCNECKQEETDLASVLNWLKVEVIRNEIPESRIIMAPRRARPRWDFCSKECLAQWAMNKTP